MRRLWSLACALVGVWRVATTTSVRRVPTPSATRSGAFVLSRTETIRRGCGAGFGGVELQNQGLGQDPPWPVLSILFQPNKAGTWTTEGAIDFEYVLNREANEATPADLHPDLPGAQWPYTPKYLSQGLFQYIDYCIQPMGYLKEDGLPTDAPAVYHSEAVAR